jgi:hypothetical protein
MPIQYAVAKVLFPSFNLFASEPRLRLQHVDVFLGKVARRRARQHCPHERENDGLIKACHLLRVETGCVGSGLVSTARILKKKRPQYPSRSSGVQSQRVEVLKLGPRAAAKDSALKLDASGRRGLQLETARRGRAEGCS